MKELKYGFWFLEFCQACIEDEYNYAAIILFNTYSDQQIPFVDRVPFVFFNKFPINLLLGICTCFAAIARFTRKLICHIKVYDGGFWFRVFGKGFSVVNREKHPALFSERIGKTRTIRFGKWAVTFLE